MHWQEQELKAKPRSQLLLRHGNVPEPGLGLVPEDATGKRSGKPPEQRKPLPLSSSTLKLKPVMLPPGLRDCSRGHFFIGSAMRVMTMGIVALAFGGLH
jgi:hypothetical protein